MSPRATLRALAAKYEAEGRHDLATLIRNALRTPS